MTKKLIHACLLLVFCTLVARAEPIMEHSFLGFNWKLAIYGSSLTYIVPGNDNVRLEIQRIGNQYKDCAAWPELKQCDKSGYVIHYNQQDQQTISYLTVNIDTKEEPKVITETWTNPIEYCFSDGTNQLVFLVKNTKTPDLDKALYAEALCQDRGNQTAASLLDLAAVFRNYK